MAPHHLGKRLVPAHSQTSEQKGPSSHLCNGQMIVACCTLETYGKLSAALGMTHSSSVQFRNSPSRVLSELWVKGCGKQLLASHGHCNRLPPICHSLLLWREPACLWITPECPCSSCSHLFSVENKSGHSSIAACCILDCKKHPHSEQQTTQKEAQFCSVLTCTQTGFPQRGPPP